MTTQSTADQLFGSDVMDNAGNKIGTVDNVWVDDATDDTEFIGVKTGWLMGKTHLIPMADAQYDGGAITVPYAQDQVKDAPSFAADHELSADEENEIYNYYGIGRQTATSPSGLPGDETGADYETDRTYADRDNADSSEVTLSEEQLQVGKQQVQAGTVRLRKVVNTDHQEVPVELQREQVSIERVDATSTDVPTNAFQEQEVEVPIMREEPVVGKQTVTTGGVRLNKGVETETRTVGGDVRSEDVEIDDDEVDEPVYTRSDAGTDSTSTNY